MAQDKRIEAFRRRLWRRGYTQVSIVADRAGRYLVAAIEPLAGVRVRRLIDMDEMGQLIDGRCD